MSERRCGRPLLALGLGAAMLLASALPPSADERRDSVLAGFQLDGGAAKRWKLPKRIAETSGLASTPDARILAHDDEHAIVYEIDSKKGRLVKAFAIGRPTVKGDFEGIAVGAGRVFLATSAGRVYEAEEAADGDRVRFHSYDTGMSDSCADAEGLAYDSSTQVLLLPCKQSRVESKPKRVRIHRWSPELRAPAEPPWIDVDSKALEDKLGKPGFRVTAIEWDAGTGHLLLLSSRPPALAEVDGSGRVVAAKILPTKHHRQAEGLTFAPGGGLIVSDEAAGKQAQMAIYPARAPRDAAGKKAAEPLP